MAESFACQSGWTHFSNEAVEALYKAWIACAREQPDLTGMTAIADYFQKLLDEEAPGCRAVGLYGDYLPDDLNTPDRLAALVTLIIKTADNPEIIKDIKWSADLAESWRERLTQMRDAVEAAIAEHGGPR